MKSYPDRRTLTVEECARFLGIGRSAAYEGVRSGQIPAVRVGGRWLVPLVALDKMLAEAGKGEGEA